MASGGTKKDVTLDLGYAESLELGKLLQAESHTQMQIKQLQDENAQRWQGFQGALEQRHGLEAGALGQSHQIDIQQGKIVPAPKRQQGTA